MTTALLVEHLCLDERGCALISGTTMKVVELALEKVAWGLSPEQILENHPYLSLAQIHAALAYYYDHKTEFDAEIEQQAQRTDALRARAGETPFEKHLREHRRRGGRSAGGQDEPELYRTEHRKWVKVKPGELGVMSVSQREAGERLLKTAERIRKKLSPGTVRFTREELHDRR